MLKANSQRVNIRPYSLIAEIAGVINKEDAYGITIGNTIYINCSRATFLADTPWVKHELTHVRQWRHYGYFGFIKRYIYYSITSGYNKNPLELEAKQ